MKVNSRTVRREQTGIALFMVVFALLGVGVLSLAVVSPDKAKVSAGQRNLGASQQWLVESRQAMLGYASFYSYLYGPQGAGPGHLPCPDTDSHTVSSRNGSSEKLRSMSDGPNPPCGTSSLASGKLPRHVRLPARQYAFHTQARQLADYRVSSQVINNPTNRVVNPGLLGRMSASEPAALIELRQGDLGHPFARVTISFDTLVAAIRPAVAAWVISKARGRSSEWCSTAHLELETAWTNLIAPEPVFPYHCQRFNELVLLCPQDVSLWLVLDQLPQTNTCASDLDALPSIEGVPAQRHWFVRNRWVEWIEVTAEEACQAEPESASNCSLKYRRPINALANPGIDDTSVRRRGIKLEWASSDEL